MSIEVSLDLLTAEVKRLRKEARDRDLALAVAREQILDLTRSRERLRALCQPPEPLMLGGEAYTIHDPDPAGTLVKLQAQMLAILDEHKAIHGGKPHQWEKTQPAALDPPKWLPTMPFELDTQPMEIR